MVLMVKKRQQGRLKSLSNRSKGEMPAPEWSEPQENREGVEGHYSFHVCAHCLTARTIRLNPKLPCVRPRPHCSNHKTRTQNLLGRKILHLQGVVVLPASHHKNNTTKGKKNHNPRLLSHVYWRHYIGIRSCYSRKFFCKKHLPRYHF
jgi:hypothetical protein